MELGENYESIFYYMILFSEYRSLPDVSGFVGFNTSSVGQSKIIHAICREIRAGHRLQQASLRQFARILVVPRGHRFGPYS